ncbi:uncharacterized protein LOC111035107 [Myzus persicae]|uniref:uncharacterized protein LOC111035107 n=1 Tax=Myzus persicae TaxID=13164 RepID=UPI000B9373BD|nr:uncharacterized protein LOC111035107 [Myzus persicae]
MTTLEAMATTSAEAAESSTARASSDTEAAAAEVIAAPPPASSVLPLASDTAEIVAISRQIRRSLDCPICLTLMSVMSCYCPNGHATCQACMMTLFSINNNRGTLCPLCRTSMMPLESTSAMVVKLAEASLSAKVACSNWSFGCPELVPVRYVNEHESACRYVPNVPCQVSVCQWVGMYEQLYEHVSNAHPGVAVESSTNRLNVTDLLSISKNRRRTYLVRSTYGMMWVLLSRASRSRIQVGLFMVDNSTLQSGRHQTSTPGQSRDDQRPTDIQYRITWFDDSGRSRTKCRTKEVNWSTTLKEGYYTASPNAYSVFRSRTGHMEISWFPLLRHNNNRRTNPSTNHELWRRCNNNSTTENQ